MGVEFLIYGRIKENTQLMFVLLTRTCSSCIFFQQFTAICIFEMQEPDNILCPSCIGLRCIQIQSCGKTIFKKMRKKCHFHTTQKVRPFPLQTEFSKWIFLIVSSLFLFVGIIRCQDQNYFAIITSLD